MKTLRFIAVGNLLKENLIEKTDKGFAIKK